MVELLTGDVTFNQFKTAWSKSPVWYLEYAGYCAAIRAAVDGKAAEAEKLAAPFATRVDGKPAWIYLAQPNAKALQEDARKLRVVLLGGKPKEDELNGFIARALPVWMPGLSQYLPKTMTAEEAMKEAERRRAAEAARKKEAERTSQVSAADARRVDLELLKNLNTQIAGLIKAKDFAGAKSAVAGTESKVKTPAGIAEVQLIKQKVDTLDGFMNFLVTGIKSLPYRGAKLSGDRVPAGADAGSLNVKGGAKIPWTNVNDADFVKLGNFYLNAARLGNPTRAKLALGMAVYVYEKGDKATARKVVAMAEQWDRTIRTQANKIMPYL